MAGKEAQFNKRLRTELERRGMSIYRVESHSTAPVMPDNFYIQEGNCGWMEIKSERVMPHYIKYRPNQAAWLVSYAAKGGIAWTLVYVEDKSQLLMIPAQESLKAAKNLRAEVQVIIINLLERLAWNDTQTILLRKKIGP